ncbi:MAG: hypothetical protein U1E94_06805 [Agitococcus sp.]
MLTTKTGIDVGSRITASTVSATVRNANFASVFASVDASRTVCIGWIRFE